jgi:integrating conjugative element protein (TIGR03757 family)
MSDLLRFRQLRVGMALVALGSALAALLPASAAAQRASVRTVEAFVNSAMVVALPAANQGYQVTVHRMDQLDIATKAVDQMIPKGGETEARRWLKDNEARVKREVTPAAIATANATNRANYYRLDRIPAVVINQRTVVYGVTDVAVALQHYQASRARKP